MSRFHIGAGVLALIGYLLSMPTGVAGGDSAELTLGAYTQGIVHAPGYPLYLMSAQGFAAVPWPLSFAGRVNLFSVVAAVGTVVLLAWLIDTIAPGAPWLAAGAAMVFGFAPTTWSNAVVAEVYALHTLLVGGVLLMWVRWWRQGHQRDAFITALLIGLGLAHHLAMALVAVVIFPVMLWRLGWRERALLCALVAAPLLFYAYLPIRSAASPAFDILSYFERDMTQPIDLLWMMRGGMFEERMFRYGLLGWLAEVGRFGLEWLRALLGIGVVVGFVGLWHLWRTELGLALTLFGVWFLQVLFFTGYDVFDKWQMFHTAYMSWVVLAGVGGVWAARTGVLSGRWLTVIMVALLSVQVGAGWRNFTLTAKHGTVTSTEQLLQLVPSDALLVGDWFTIRPVEYYQIVEGARTDIRLYDYTLVSLGLRDTLGIDGPALSETTRQAIFDTIDCGTGPIYIINQRVLQERYELRTVTDRLHQVMQDPARYPCAYGSVSP
ncbi:MAG: DUF2723 domain-containing protein [Chloroflexota bacterium]